MGDEEPPCDELSYLISRSRAIRLLGVLPSEFGHILWIKGVPTLRIGVSEYVRRRDILAAIDDLFEECGELMEKLVDVDPQDFIQLYDERFPLDVRGELSIRNRIMSAVFATDYRDTVWMVNFCCSIGLSDEETARTAEVMKDLGHLTKTGEIYQRALKRRTGGSPEETA